VPAKAMVEQAGQCDRRKRLAGCVETWLLVVRLKRTARAIGAAQKKYQRELKMRKPIRGG